jgi:hypothetical protein
MEMIKRILDLDIDASLQGLAVVDELKYKETALKHDGVHEIDIEASIGCVGVVPILLVHSEALNMRVEYL